MAVASPCLGALQNACWILKRSTVPRVSRLQDQNLQLEKARADLTLDLKRSTAAKEAAENVAKAAQVELQGVLAELDNAKHSTEAASTTSQFVCKVRMCWHMNMYMCACVAYVYTIRTYVYAHTVVRYAAASALRCDTRGSG
jgi:hypothetical protein